MTVHAPSWATENPPVCGGFRESPLPDSNRRPLPYHARAVGAGTRFLPAHTGFLGVARNVPVCGRTGRRVPPVFRTGA
jgi:hypothetical protein